MRKSPSRIFTAYALPVMNCLCTAQKNPSLLAYGASNMTASPPWLTNIKHHKRTEKNYKMWGRRWISVLKDLAEAIWAQLTVRADVLYDIVARSGQHGFQVVSEMFRHTATLGWFWNVESTSKSTIVDVPKCSEYCIGHRDLNTNCTIPLTPTFANARFFKYVKIRAWLVLLLVPTAL